MIIYRFTDFMYPPVMPRKNDDMKIIFFIKGDNEIAPVKMLLVQFSPFIGALSLSVLYERQVEVFVSLSLSRLSDFIDSMTKLQSFDKLCGFFHFANFVAVIMSLSLSLTACFSEFFPSVPDSTVLQTNLQELQ